jgi:small subunit ribosomal protein S21
MLIVKVEDSIEKAVKKLKRKFDKVKIGKELRMRKEFKKKSDIKRESKSRAIYLKNKYDQCDNS